MRNNQKIRPANYEQILEDIRNGNHRDCYVCVGELGEDKIEMMSGIWPVYVHERCCGVVHEWNEKREARRSRTGIAPGAFGQVRNRE